MKDKILIIGGTGNVGRLIVSDLIKDFSNRILVACRTRTSGEALREDFNNNIDYINLDIKTETSFAFLDNVKVVLVCLDIVNEGFIKACLERDIDYINITADYNIINTIKKISNENIESKSTMVLGVGLSPGLTNLLAKRGLEKLDTEKECTISILFGTGDAHGKAALYWMAENINKVYEIQKKGITKSVESFSIKGRANFPLNYGQMSTYNFNFADQHIIREVYGTNSSITNVTYSSKFLTNMFYIFKKIKLLKLLKKSKIQDQFVKIMSKPQNGPKHYIVKVDVNGKKNGVLSEYNYAFSGENESLLTGVIAKYVLSDLYKNSSKPGFYFIDQLYSYEELESEFSNYINVYNIDK